MKKNKKLINIIGFGISIMVGLLSYFIYNNSYNKPDLGDEKNKIVNTKVVDKKIIETNKVKIKEKINPIINGNSSFINKKIEEKNKSLSTEGFSPLKEEKKINDSKGQKNNVEKNISIISNPVAFFRNGDRINISATVYNNTEEEKSLKIKFDSKDIEVNKIKKSIVVGANSSKKISFWVKDGLKNKKNIKYILYALGNSKENSDIIQRKINFKKHPSLNPIFLKGGIAKKGIKQNFKINIPKNTDLEKSKVKISFSNNLEEINKEISNYLNSYPYGKIGFDIKKTLDLFEKYNYNGLSKFAFSIGTIHNREKRFSIGGNNKIIKREFILDDIVQYKEDYIELTTYILSGKNIFTSLTLDIVPKDKFIIEEKLEDMKITRKVFELDSNKEITDFNFKLNKKYKVKISINLGKKYLGNSNNLVLKNYIPSGFISEKTITSGESKNWEKIKYFSDKIIVENNINLGGELEFEYIFIPKFVGEYIFPPETLYFKNNSEIKVNNKFEKIFVK